jgi:exocyst complex component 6
LLSLENLGIWVCFAVYSSTNVEHFQVACSELERSLTNLRTAQQGGTIRLKALSAFDATLTRCVARIKEVINSKLDDFFELSEYNWVPTSREDGPNMYLYELVNWLTTVVDSQLLIAPSYIDEAYMGAAEYIAECFMDFLSGRNIVMMNENAISNLLVDCDFLETEFRRIGRPHLSSAFNELRATTGIVLSDTVQEYLIPANRQTSYAAVKHKRLQALLEKLAQYGSTRRDNAGRQLGEKRRKQAEAVGRLFPGEWR